MAVLIEGLSVVIRGEALLSALDGDWEAFRSTVPNATLCADGEIVRVGFMSPHDAERYVAQLCSLGLRAADAGRSGDVVLVDQDRGMLGNCDWLEFGSVGFQGDPQKPVPACRATGSRNGKLITPDGWTYERWKAGSVHFLSYDDVTFVRHENGLDVYRVNATGEEVYAGRTHRADT